MPTRKYRAIPERWREAYSPITFTINLQVWLVLLSLSLFMVTLLWQPVCRWWGMVNQLNFLQWVAFIMGSGLLVLALSLAVVSFVSFVILVWRGWRGVEVEQTPTELKSPEQRVATMEVESALITAKITELRAQLDVTEAQVHELQARLNEVADDRSK